MVSPGLTPGDHSQLVTAHRPGHRGRAAHRDGRAAIVEIRELGDADVLAWAGLLALTFGRNVDDMLKLWRWFNTGYHLVAWGAWDGARLVAQYSCLQSSLLLPHYPEPFSIGISTNRPYTRPTAVGA